MKPIEVFAIYMDRDRSGNHLECIALTEKKAKEFCKGNGYLAYEKAMAIKVDEEYYLLKDNCPVKAYQ